MKIQTPPVDFKRRIALKLLVVTGMLLTSAFTSMAAVPAEPTSTATASGSVELIWNANSDANLAGYRVYRSLQSGVFPSSAIGADVLLAAPRFTDSTVDAGRTYYYVVTAVSINGVESAPSNEIQVGIAMQSGDAPPTVSLTAPSAGASVSGATVTVSASATDDVAVAGVQFRINGVSLGAEDTTAPYSVVLATTMFPDGVHSLTAVARDSAGRMTTSSASSVTIGNTNFTLTVSTTGSGSGMVISSPGGISCGTACSAPSTPGADLTLVAAPDAGSTFGGWSGDDDCADGSVTMTSRRNCVARFDIPQSSSTSLRGDFDGDGKTDVAVYRPSTGEWFLRLSTEDYTPGAGHSYFKLGAPADLPVVGDFDGDGKTDITVYRPSTGEWFLELSTESYAPGAGDAYFQWGVPGDVPALGDFDGDNKTDIGVYRPATGQWFLRFSTERYTQNHVFELGSAGDVPVVGDFDGDGKADITVYRPSTADWFLRLSAQHYASGADSHFQSGTTGDQPLAGDFDGDGKADIAGYRPSTGEWFFRLSTQGYTTAAPSLYFQWGQKNDRPTVGDFDGDGKADITAFRPSTGEWFVRPSSSGYGNVWHFGWGEAGDLPLPR